MKSVRSPRVSKGSRRKLPSLTVGLLTLICGANFIACKQGERRSRIPADAQTVLDTSIQDIDAGRYEKLYNDAGDEWRKDSTLEESKATLQRLHDKLGRMQVRNLDTAREEQTGTAPIAGHSLVAIYQTQFERGDAMETFILIEHGGKWYLAKYLVTSTALK
ncbi:MAG TPA: DUF4019 domain-containing protein [Pyrinomonadaceae bacterium]|nr:DUF4019 domain-containing protein [Pyrinomonadaceae bacterium]